MDSQNLHRAMLNKENLCGTSLIGTNLLGAERQK
ncbi:hypothetical protein [Paenibacillus piscarius]